MATFPGRPVSPTLQCLMSRIRVKVKCTDYNCLHLMPTPSPVKNRPWSTINRTPHPVSSLVNRILELFFLHFVEQVSSLGDRIESSLSRDSGVVGSLLQLLYLSFNFINISYLLYFSDSALLSTFIYLPKSECSTCARKYVFLQHQAKLSLSLFRILSYKFSRSDQRAQVGSLS